MFCWIQFLRRYEDLDSDLLDTVFKKICGPSVLLDTVFKKILRPR